jgi:hypothetical protein
MDAIRLPLTLEMREALAANGGTPLRLEDPETHELYLLVEAPVEITLDDEYIRQSLQLAVDQFERGEFGPWDVEATLAEAHRRHAEKQRNQ